MTENFSKHIANYLKYLIIFARNSGLSPEQILDRIKLCSLDSALWGSLENGLIQSQDIQIPEQEISERIKSFKLTQTARSSLWVSSLRKCIESLDEIPFLLLKGLPLSQIWHGSELWRSTNDLDIWVPRDSWKPAVKKLEKIGYSCRIEPHLWATNQILLNHPVLAPVEIHWKLIPSPWLTPGFEYAFKRSRIFPIHDLNVRIPGDGDLFLHLILHAHQHYFAPRTLADICGALERLEPDTVLLDAYGILGLYEKLRSLLTPICQGNSPKPACIQENLLHMLSTRMFCGKMLDGIMLGDNSAFQAVVGTLMRSLSMGLLDGAAYQLRAGSTVLFYGPHRLGAWLSGNRGGSGVFAAQIDAQGATAPSKLHKSSPVTSKSTS